MRFLRIDASCKVRSTAMLMAQWEEPGGPALPKPRPLRRTPPCALPKYKDVARSSIIAA